MRGRKKITKKFSKLKGDTYSLLKVNDLLDDINDLFKIGVSGVAVISAILNENNPTENFQKMKENIIKGLEK